MRTRNTSHPHFLASTYLCVLVRKSGGDNHVCMCLCAQALRAAHNRSLEMLAEVEARLKEEAAAKAVRDEKEQQVRHSSDTLRGTLPINHCLL